MLQVICFGVFFFLGGVFVMPYTVSEILGSNGIVGVFSYFIFTYLFYFKVVAITTNSSLLLKCCWALSPQEKAAHKRQPSQ